MWETVSVVVLCFVFVTTAFALTGAILLNWDRCEDKRYTMQMRKHPEKYDICAECGRPRPHKKMTYIKGRGWICYRHFGVAE